MKFRYVICIFDVFLHQDVCSALGAYNYDRESETGTDRAYNEDKEGVTHLSGETAHKQQKIRERRKLGKLSKKLYVCYILFIKVHA